MACADCKHYGKGWRDDIGRCRWDPAEGWPLVYAFEDYPVVNEWDGEGCPQFKERNDGEVIAITSPALPSGLDSGRGFVFENGGSAPMASEDVMDRYAARTLSGGSSRQDDTALIDDLAAEVRAQRARAERAERAERDKDELLEVRQSLHAAMMLEWRGVEHGCECLACGGAGVKSYPSTSTWRGGIGGQAFTTDVCDKCWGSGDRNNAWPSHRALVEACKGGRDHG